MDEVPEPPEAAGIAHRPTSSRPAHGVVVEGLAAFHAALKLWMDEAIAAQARELWWADADFDAWPLGERAWIESLDRWVGAGRRLVVLAADDSRMAQRHPRWASWRRTWSHGVDLRVVDRDLAEALPTLALLPGRGALEVVDPVHSRAVWVRERAALQRCHEALRTLLERSAPGQAVTTLGL